MSTGEVSNPPPEVDQDQDQDIDLVAGMTIALVNDNIFHRRHSLASHVAQFADLIANNLQHCQADGVAVGRISIGDACICHDMVRATVVWQTIAYAQAGKSDLDVWVAASNLVKSLLE